MKIIELDKISSKSPQDIVVSGWIWQKRSQGKLIFIELFDGTTHKSLQITVKKNQLPEGNFDEVQGIYRGAAVQVTGQLKSDERAPFGREVLATKIDVIHPSSEEYDQLVPEDAGVDVKLNKRHIVFRSPKASSILRMRSKVLQYSREFFFSKGAEEVSPPTIVEAQAEGGAEVFELKYFDRKAYLTQSSQLYLETAIFALRDVFCVLPSYRAEKSRTRRHLTEYTHVEGEYAFMDFEGLLDYLEDYIIYVLKKIKKNEKDLLELFDINLKIPKKPFPRITYAEAIKLLKDKFDIEVPFGEDISDAPERELVAYFGTPIILQKFPTSMKPFYHKINDDDQSITNSADFIFPGLGEVIGCSQRETDIESMLERMVKMNPPLNPEEYEWYLDLRRYGSVPHSGFGLGLERLVQWILGVDHIRDICLFPRMINRVSP
jgi:asparaginyl-tRNA synthetase